MVQQDIDLNNLIKDDYIPSSVERKKSILMYFFVGIVAALTKEKISVYEYFHLRQSLGRWSLFFVFMVIGIVLMFIPYLWIIPLIIFLSFFVVWCIFTLQARKWEYVLGKDTIFLPFFVGMGGWIVAIFEIEVGKVE